jgi:DNA polymerase-1
MVEFGPDRFGVELKINPEGEVYGNTLVVDVETDERGNFVGIGIMDRPTSVSYFSVLSPDLRRLLSVSLIIGHNIKFDARQLKSWGIDIKPEQLVQDTMLKSYVRSSTKDSHGLKELAREYLSMEWPSYHDMVGRGKAKQTLDKQDVEKVAAYCGDDCIATYRLNEYFDKVMTPPQKSFYSLIELPTMQLLYKMELTGVTVDVDYLKDLKKDFDYDNTSLRSQLGQILQETGYVLKHKKSCPKKEHAHEFNPASPIQVKDVLQHLGYSVQATDKQALEPFRKDEFVSTLLELRKVAKVSSTYIDAWLELQTLPKIHTTFNQVALDSASDSWKGIRTGRLSSSEPNLHNIPKPGDDEEETTGKALRRAFIASPGNTLIVADYSQIQYRLLAHYSKEPILIKAFLDGKDVHEATGDALGVSRSIGKTLNFAAIFGAFPEKIAQVAHCSEDQAKEFLARYWRVLPGVRMWMERVRMLARVHRSVKTIFGRVIPINDIDSNDRGLRAHAERTAINYIIQGGEADIMKVAMREVAKAGHFPILQVHDELHFDEPYNESDPLSQIDIQKRIAEIKFIMEGIVKLDVPLTVSIAHGGSWYAAKD